MKLSVVVVAYRQRDALRECLNACSVAAERVPGSELIVVDNGSVAQVARECFPAAKVVVPGFNSGFAGGVARGLAVAEGRWVALVNDDATVAANALVEMVAAGERSDRVGAVAGQVRFRSAPDRVNSAGISVDRLGIATERLAGAPIEAAGEACEVFGPSGCFALYRRAMLTEIGGFDERFFAYLEDVDVAWRARAAGWRCVYEPRAIAYHVGSASSAHGSEQKYFLVGRNRIRLLARNATARQLLIAWPAMAAYDCAYVAYAGITDRTLAPLRGRLAGLRSWRGERRRCRSSVALGRVSLRASLGQHRAYRELARPGQPRLTAMARSTAAANWPAGDG
jgi:GT2 family glycosyltransferase